MKSGLFPAKMVSITSTKLVMVRRTEIPGRKYILNNHNDEYQLVE